MHQHLHAHRQLASLMHLSPGADWQRSHSNTIKTGTTCQGVLRCRSKHAAVVSSHAKQTVLQLAKSHLDDTASN